MVVTIAETNDVTSLLDESLDGLDITTQIVGPVITSLWKILDIPTTMESKPSMQSIHEQILTHEHRLTKARNEIVVAQTLSEFMQSAAQQQVEGIVKELQFLREAAGAAPAEKGSTYAAVDKKRADAVQHLQDWDGRKRAKEDSMVSEVQVALTAVDDAILALQQQKQAIQQKQKTHQAAWLQINGAHRRAQCTRIVELEARCKESKAEKAIGDGTGNPTTGLPPTSVVHDSSTDCTATGHGENFAKPAKRVKPNANLGCTK
jgi:hypothetical protein